MKIGIASVALSRRTATGVETTHTLSWRIAYDDREKMRGAAIKAAMESKPGFSVDSVLVDIVDIQPEEKP